MSARTGAGGCHGGSGGGGGDAVEPVAVVTVGMATGERCAMSVPPACAYPRSRGSGGSGGNGGWVESAPAA